MDLLSNPDDHSASNKSALIIVVCIELLLFMSRTTNLGELYFSSLVFYAVKKMGFLNGPYPASFFFILIF